MYRNKNEIFKKCFQRMEMVRRDKRATGKVSCFSGIESYLLKMIYLI